MAGIDSLPPALLGILLGLSLAAPPGPMNALIANHAARGGWWHGVRVGVAAPIADVCYLIVFAAGIGQALDQPLILRSLALVGCAIMLWFAWGAWRATDKEPSAKGFAQAFAVAVTNPFQVAWWLTAGTVFVQDQGPMWVIGFISGIFGWVAAFAGLVALGARKWKWFPPVVRVVSATVLVLSAVVLFAFGLRGT